MSDPGPSTPKGTTTIVLPEYLYHYTSYEKLKKIFGDGKVCASPSEFHGIFDPGVYLTAFAPEVGRRRIGWNNKGGGIPFTAIYLPSIIAAEKTECYLKFKSDRLASQLHKIKKEVSRDVWKFKGDILLEGEDWFTFGFVDERGRTISQLNKIHGKNGWSHSIKEATIGK